MKSSGTPRIRNRFALLALFIVFGLLWKPLATFGADDIIIICHPTVPVKSLQLGEINKIYRGIKKRWNNGEKIDLVILNAPEITNCFLRTFTEKSNSQFFTFWKKKVFSGKARMPRTFKTEADVVRFVAQTPFSIGYISRSTPTQSVNTISVVP